MRSWIYITDGWTEEHEANSCLSDFKSGIRDICDRRIFSIASKLKPERIDRMCADVYSDYSGTTARGKLI